jgi:hypothetical protein
MAYRAVMAKNTYGRTAIVQTARAAENGPQTFGSLRRIQDGECRDFAQWLCVHWHTAAVVA